MAIERGEVNRNIKIQALVKMFMSKLGDAADGEDWTESDGWVGQFILLEEGGRQVYTYAVKDGAFLPSDSQGPFVATIRMGVDGFLDLIDAALSGQAICPTCGTLSSRRRPCSRCQEVIPAHAASSAEQVFENMYRKGLPLGIRYDGDRWIVDSERFRKVFKRLGGS